MVHNEPFILSGSEFLHIAIVWRDKQHLQNRVAIVLTIWVRYLLTILRKNSSPARPKTAFVHVWLTSMMSSWLTIASHTLNCLDRHWMFDAWQKRDCICQGFWYNGWQLAGRRGSPVCSCVSTLRQRLAILWIVREFSICFLIIWQTQQSITIKFHQMIIWQSTEISSLTI